MIKKILLLLLVLTIIVTPAVAQNNNSEPGQGSRYSPPEFDIQSAAAILIDVKTGEMLYEHNKDADRQPASLTKAMTGLVVIGHLESGEISMDDMVTVSKEAITGFGNDSSSQGLKEGEEINFKDLLYCALISSSNESCNVIAQHISGSVEAFVAEMNEKAAALGMTNTNFINTHGYFTNSLSDPLAATHRTTAYDMYLLCAEIMRHEELIKIFYTEKYTTAPTNKTPGGRNLNTTNRLIARRSSDPDDPENTKYRYPEAKGIKTGFTNAAGYCLATCAEKDGRVLICVVMGAQQEEDTKLIRSFTEARALFEWGFNNFRMEKVLAKGTDVRAEVSVSLGKDSDRVALVPQEDLWALVQLPYTALKPEDLNPVFEPNVTAPVTKGQILGSITIPGYGTVDLVANVDVKLDGAESLKQFFLNLLKKFWWVIAVVLGLVISYIILLIIYNYKRKKQKETVYGNYKGKKKK